MGTFFITGATGGIGAETATLLAKAGHRLIAVSRTDSTERAMLDRISREVPNADIEILRGDLAVMGDINRIAREVEASTSTLDGILLNAGVASARMQLTSEGVESTFAVNHLGAILLAHRLLPIMSQSPGGRIVVSGSSDHFAVKQFDIAAVSKGENYSYTRAYAQSKFFVMAATFELARRIGQKYPNVFLNVADPGWARTGLTRDAPLPIRMLVRLGKPMQNSAVDSARLLVDLATNTTETGTYVGMKSPGKLSALVQDQSVQRRVYDETMEMLESMAGSPKAFLT